MLVYNYHKTIHLGNTHPMFSKMKAVVLTLVLLCLSVFSYGQSQVRVLTVSQLIESPASPRLLEENVQVYPNPVVDMFRVGLRGLKGESAKIDILDSSGKNVYTKSLDNIDQPFLQLSAFSVGLKDGEDYNVTVISKGVKVTRSITIL